MTSPPTVVASVSHVVRSSAAASSTAMPPGSRMRPSGSCLRHRVAGLELVADVAEHLRQHVFEREQAGRAAELVHDERLMRSPLAQVAQHAVGGDAFVHARDRPDQRAQPWRSLPSLTSQRTRSFVCSRPTMLSIESR